MLNIRIMTTDSIGPHINFSDRLIQAKLIRQYINRFRLHSVKKMDARCIASSVMVDQKPCQLITLSIYTIHFLHAHVYIELS